MGIEALGLAAGAAEGFVEGYFYDKKVDKLSTAVEKVMANAHDRARSLMADGFSGLTVQQVEFFNHVDLTLQGVKNIYAEQMNKTVNTVDQKAQAILATVDSMVHQWNRELVGPHMQQLMWEAKALVNSLPFVDHRPRLTAFSPVVVAPSSQPLSVVIKCIGNFPSLSDSMLKPTFHLNEKIYPSISIQPHISFAVPLHDLFPLGGHSAHGIKSTSFEVKIPYKNPSYWSYLVPFFQTKETYDTYQGSICLLPEHPGKITIYYTKLREVVETEKITSVEYEQNSRDKDHGGEGKTLTKSYTLKPKAGWKIVPGSAKFHVMSSKDHQDGPKGLKNKWENQLETPDQATYLVTTHNYKPTSHCGKIKFKLLATQSKSYFVSETTKEEYTLKWGESKIIDESKGSWVVHFDSFDGIHNQMPGYGSARFFSVKSFGGQPVLVIDPPQQVSSHFLLTNQEKG